MLKLFRRWQTRHRFKQAFKADLKRIEDQRARHAQVKPSQAELQARVHDALRRRVSA